MKSFFLGSHFKVLFKLTRVAFHLFIKQTYVSLSYQLIRSRCKLLSLVSAETALDNFVSFRSAAGIRQSLQHIRRKTKRAYICIYLLLTIEIVYVQN